MTPTPSTPPPAPGARVAATVLLVAVSLALVVLWLTGPGERSPYRVTLTFENASQLVEGNEVVIGGNTVGTVERLDLTADGLAAATVSVDEPWAPLRRGTRAIIREPAQASFSNRYITLLLPESAGGAPIPDGGTLSPQETTTAVEFDSVFNLFDRRTRRATQRFFTRGHEQFRGKAEAQASAYRYLDPMLSTSVELFRELNRDAPVLERFVVDSQRLVTALAERRDDLAESVQTTNETFRALGHHRATLARLIERLPPVMSRANTVSAEVRGTLDELDPLVEASEPVARATQPWLAEFTPLLRDARPVIEDLDALTTSPGADNDMIELTRSYAPLARVALDRIQINGAERDGAFPETTRALDESDDIIAFGRPYTADLFGLFEDYGTINVYDALGMMARTQTVINAFSAQSGLPTFVPLDERAQDIVEVARTGQYWRCPGGADVPYADGSNVLSEGERRRLDCRESDRALP